MLREVIGKALSSRRLVLTKDMVDIGGTRHIPVPNVGDYVRIAALDLAIGELRERKVAGSVAELGVFRGDFARLLNVGFPDRKLYLFDTFEGFDPGDVSAELKNEYLEKDQVGDFSGTSVELVMSKMAHPENVIVRKGYFPESLGGLEDVFCFVSLDADLFEPTYEGLKYFYPRMAPGAYMFLHDYAHGVKEAVDRFRAQEDLKLVALPDVWHTAVVVK